MRTFCPDYFVNPTQFGPNEDLSSYPRTFENDLRIAARENVDVVFAPTPDQIYPLGYTTYVEETSLSKPLCGQSRPGHFRGVTTVVLKLLNLIRPEIAFFGQKDAQQFFVLDKMVRDLNLDIKVQGVATVRESDGLALSSRNAYLTEEERAKAPKLFQELQKLRNEIASCTLIGSGDLLSVSTSRLTEQGFKVQYLECVSLPDFQEQNEASLKPGQPALIAIAAYLGKTRLIDNIILNPEPLRAQGIYLE